MHNKDKNEIGQYVGIIILAWLGIHFLRTAGLKWFEKILIKIVHGAGKFLKVVDEILLLILLVLLVLLAVKAYTESRNL